ncbi:MAG: tetratricopeptide repeat protein, partial [Bacteroidota bacterium]
MIRKVFSFFTSLCLLVSCFGQDPDHIRTPGEVRQSIKTAATDYDRAIMLLDEAIAYVLKPGSEISDLDSANRLIDQVYKINSILNDKHVEAKSLLASAEVLHDRGDTASGHAAINKAIDIYKNLSVPDELGEAYLHLGTYFMLESLQDVGRIIPVYENALTQFRKSANKKRVADTLKELADFNQIVNKHGLALVQLKEALSLYQSIGFKAVQGVYDLMGSVSEYLGDYANAVQYGLLAVKTAAATQDTTIQLCTIYSRLAIAYADWSKEEEADLYFSKAMAIAEKYHDKGSIDLVMV